MKHNFNTFQQLSIGCYDDSQVCNCDNNDNTWREDSGVLTNKTNLPVTEMRFGETGHSSESLMYQLGPLKCKGLGKQ